MPRAARGRGAASYELLCVPGLVVAGDIVDVIELGTDANNTSRAAIIIGDVMGKGAPAGMLMASIQARISQGLADGVALDRLVAELNRDTSKRCPGIMVSLWIGVMTHDRTLNSITLTYVDAGHGLCLIRHPDGKVSSLSEAGGLVMGVSDWVEYRTAELPLTRGTHLVLFTDGLPEQPDPEGRQLGMEAVERCVGSDLAPGADASPSTDLARALSTTLQGHAAATAQRDDVTMLVVSC
jgi:phosphoserine phosphatase RsbU/P